MTKENPLLELPLDQHIRRMMEEPTADEEKRQLFEIQKTMLSPGWTYLSQMWETQREELLKQSEKVNEDGGRNGWRAMQGALRGFRLAIEIPQKLFRRAVQMAEETEEGR